MITSTYLGIHKESQKRYKFGKLAQSVLCFWLVILILINQKSKCNNLHRFEFITRMESAMKRNDYNFNLVKNTPQGIVTLNKQWKITVLNSSYFV